jgi:rubrerythrin
MTDPVTLDQLDRDGALQETAAAAEAGVSRASLLRRGAVLAGGGLLLGGIPVGRALAQGGLPKGDVDILNYALTLEYLEAAFYKEAVSSGELSGEAATFAQVVAAHEQAHVDALKQTLGSKAVKEPSFDFGGATGKAKFLRTAQVLEDTGVAAYQGQADRIKTPAVLTAAASILAVEARHAGWVRDIIGGGEGINPAPDAFEMPKSMDEILSAVKSTGFLKG